MQEAIIALSRERRHRCDNRIYKRRSIGARCAHPIEDRRPDDGIAVVIHVVRKLDPISIGQNCFQNRRDDIVDARRRKFAHIDLPQLDNPPASVGRSSGRKP